jgi:hypothetical protein
VLLHKGGGRIVEHLLASPAKIQLGAEREVFAGDLAAETGTAAGDQDALAFEEIRLEHDSFSYRIAPCRCRPPR